MRGLDLLDIHLSLPLYHTHHSKSSVPLLVFLSTLPIFFPCTDQISFHFFHLFFLSIFTFPNSALSQLFPYYFYPVFLLSSSHFLFLCNFCCHLTPSPDLPLCHTVSIYLIHLRAETQLQGRLWVQTDCARGKVQTFAEETQRAPANFHNAPFGPYQRVQ